MKRVMAWYLVFLIVLSTLTIAQEDASAAAEKDINAAAPGKCGFFCRMENWLRNNEVSF